MSNASVKGLKGCKTLSKDQDPKNLVEGKEERERQQEENKLETENLPKPRQNQLTKK
ncbi:hypothetical protein JHK85_027942 [Glycine max]|nr:hypothetical protein JHK85_027942 [Glycine max]